MKIFYQNSKVKRIEKFQNAWNSIKTKKITVTRKDAKAVTTRPIPAFYKFNLQHGGAALEYLMVSLFAAFLTISFMGVVSKVAKQKLASLIEKVDPEFETPDLEIDF